MKLPISGHEIDLQDVDKDSICTDVIILRRVIRHDADGDLEDAILADWTPSTTGIIRTGIYQLALDTERGISPCED